MKAYRCSNCHRENDFEGGWWEEVKHNCACGATVTLWAGNVFPVDGWGEAAKDQPTSLPEQHQSVHEPD